MFGELERIWEEKQKKDLFFLAPDICGVSRNVI